jgi:hypothetical protein
MLDSARKVSYAMGAVAAKDAARYRAISWITVGITSVRAAGSRTPKEE